MQPTKDIVHTPYFEATKGLSCTTPTFAGVKRWWLQDTGSGNDLTQRSNLPKRLLGMIQKAVTPLILETANGLIPANETAHMQLPVLEENIEP